MISSTQVAWSEHIEPPGLYGINSVDYIMNIYSCLHFPHKNNIIFLYSKSLTIADLRGTDDLIHAKLK